MGIIPALRAFPLKPLLHLWVGLFCLLCFCPVQALLAQASPAHYASKNGLPTDIVKHTIVDAHGFLWMATDEGLVRHDGIKAKDFSKTLPSHYVKQIYPSASGLLYVVTDLGIVTVESLSDTAFVRPFLKGDGQLTDSTLQWPKGIYEDAKGRFWVGESNVVRVEGGKIVKRYMFEPPYNKASFTRGFSFAEDGWGTLWALANSGHLFWLDEEANVFRMSALPIAVGSIDAVWRRGEGVLWVGGDKGVFQINLLENHAVKDCHIISDLINISALWVRSNGHVFIGTYNNGVHEGWMRHGMLKMNKAPGVDSDVQSLYGDDWENIWASCMTGSYQIKQTYMGTFSSALGYSNSVTQMATGEVFFTNGSGLSSAFWSASGHLEEQSGLKERLTAQNRDLPPQRMMSLATVGQKLWMGVDYGWVYCYDLATGKFWRAEGSKVAESVFFMTGDSYGNVWSCHDQYNGILRTDSTGKSQGYSQQLQTRLIVARESPSGEMYFGGLTADAYLFRYDRASDSFVNLSQDLPDAQNFAVNDIAFGEKDTIWLGTSAGVMYYTPESIGKASWYSSEAWGAVHAMANFPDGKIWVGCKPGIIQYNKGDINLLNQNSGLASNFINYRGIFVSKDGQAFVATSEGTSFIEYSSVVLTQTPKPFVSYLESGGSKLMLHEGLALSSGDYLIARFSVLAYPANQQEYQYRLSAQDAWSKSFAEPEVVLYQLQAGNYELQIRARQQGGYQWSKPLILPFKVSLPWHKQWWAYILFAIAGLGIIWVAVQVNTIRLKKEKERLEKIIRDRTKEIWEKNKALEIQKEEIQLQNAALQSQKEEIQAQNEELIQLTEEISSQRDKIEQQHHALESSYEDIKVVSAIGKDIHSSLSLSHIISTVYQHICLLMPADTFVVGVYEPAQKGLAVSWVGADHLQVAQNLDLLDDPTRLLPWCFREKKSVIINDFQKEVFKYLNTADTSNIKFASHIYLPLMYKDEPLGVLSVQSVQLNAYVPRHLTVLQALGSYIATALDNSRAYAIIRTKNDLITDSIRYAQQIQQAILPSAERLSKAFSEHFAIYRPKDIVSGDFYWMAQRPSKEEGKENIYLATVDCTGHGVPGAFMSMIGSRILNEVVFEQDIEEPQEILSAVDSHVRMALHQDVRHGKEGVTDGMDMSFCQLQRQTDGTIRVLFAGAKSHLLYWDGKQLHRIKGGNRAIGGMKLAEYSKFEQHELVLHAGNILYLATDGFVDQSNADRKKLGTPMLVQLLEEACHGMNLNEQKLHLEHALNHFQGASEQRDDITLLGFKL